MVTDSRFIQHQGQMGFIYIDNSVTVSGFDVWHWPPERLRSWQFAVSTP